MTVEPLLEDAGFDERAHGTITSAQAVRLAACIDADPSARSS